MKLQGIYEPRKSLEDGPDVHESTWGMIKASCARKEKKSDDMLREVSLGVKWETPPDFTMPCARRKTLKQNIGEDGGRISWMTLCEPVCIENQE